MSTTAIDIIETRLTVAEAAISAKVDKSTINRWMTNGTLRFTRTLTGRIRIEPDDLKATLSLS